MATVAALLDRRPALLALRRAFPRSTVRVLTARSPAHLDRLLRTTLIDAVVIGADAVRGPVIEALRREYAAIPIHLMLPLRSDDADVVLRAHRLRVAAVVIEGLDEPLLPALVGRHSVTSHRQLDLLPLAGSLHLTERLQRAAWEVIVLDAPRGIDTAGIAHRLGVSRETLSRQFAAGGAPSIKRAVDAVRLVAAGQLLGNPAYRVGDAARLLGFSSVSLLQRTARRTFGVAARAVAALDSGRITGALLDQAGAPDWS